MKLGFLDCVKAAFSFRPIGMFIPPNWIGLGLFGLLGLLSPGFWLVGAGLELGYLYLLSTDPRFQRLVKARYSSEHSQEWDQRIQRMVSELGPEDQDRYWMLEGRCRGILKQQAAAAGSEEGLPAQSEGLGRLTWIYLQLLLTRRAIRRILRDSEESRDGERIEDRLSKLEEKLKDQTLTDELRRSLSGQVEILQQRLHKRREAREKMDYLEAELTRIEEQVELIREQAALSTDPQGLSQRIDNVTATLAGTTEWIGEQSRIFGQVEDMMTQPAPLSIRPPVRTPEKSR